MSLKDKLNQDFLRDPVDVLDIKVGENLPVDLIKLIIPFTEAITKAFNDQRGFDSVRYYYGLHGGEPYTLQEIGDAIGISRERVRQINTSTLRRVERCLFGQQKVKGHFVPEQITEEAITLREKLVDRGGLLSFDSILKLIEDRYGRLIHRSEHGHLKFLLIVFGFKELPQTMKAYNGSNLNAWQLNTYINVKNLWPALVGSYRVLVKSIIPISLSEIQVKLNRKRKKKIEAQYIEYAIDICPDIEKLDDGLFQIAFFRLSSVADQAYRILYTKQEPTHFRDLLQEINHRLSIATSETTEKKSLTGQFTGDKRFKPIGKSGKWILSEWNQFTTKIITNIIQDFFHKKKEKASLDEICDYVLTKRPETSKKSILTYLYEKDEFVRVSQHEYELAIWGSQEYKYQKQRKNVPEILIKETHKLFGDRQQNSMLQSELIKTLHEKTGISKSTITGWLYRTPFIQILPTKGKSNEVILTKDPQPKPSRKTLMQRVADEITSYLEKQPNFTATVGDTAAYVTQKTDCKKSTFYNYLNRVEAVSKERQGSVIYCFLKKRDTEKGSDDQIA